MNANDQHFARDAKVDSAAVAPLPASRKIYVEGSRADVRVPMREVRQSDTPASFGAEENPSLVVYDTSGPYTDPDGDHRPPPRPGAAARGWIGERGDTEELGGDVGLRPARLADPALAGLRFDRTASPAREARRHRSPRCTTRAAASSRRRWSSSPSARTRARSRRAAAGIGSPPALRAELRRRPPGDHHARVRPRRGGARPRDHSRQHQPPGDRADDHRPQLPGEDQRQHRQLRGVLVDRRGGGEDALGDPLGRRHGDGSVHRQEHPRDARVDPAQLAGADRHGADLPGARKGRRQGRGPDLGGLPRHPDRAGRAGRRLLHHPRRRAAALRAADREAR